MSKSARGWYAMERTGPSRSARRWRGRPWFGLALVTVFLLAACGSPQATPGLTHALPADFTISAYQGADVLGGDEVQLSELLTQGKPVVLNLWAGLCPSCRFEMPDFQAVNDAYADEIVLVGVDIGPYVGLGSRADGRALLRELGITYAVGTTFDENVVRDDIAPIYHPEFVTADEADYADGELVLGVAIGDEAKAYPIGLLSQREMVNDQLAGIPILATW